MFVASDSHDRRIRRSGLPEGRKRTIELRDRSQKHCQALHATLVFECILSNN